MGGEQVCGVLQSKKQEMVGLLTPNVVVVTDLSSFLSSILLCGRKGKGTGITFIKVCL